MRCASVASHYSAVLDVMWLVAPARQSYLFEHVVYAVR